MDKNISKLTIKDKETIRIKHYTKQFVRCVEFNSTTNLKRFNYHLDYCTDNLERCMRNFGKNK